ncbi:MAG: MvaI/BcnI restriction endonuclease family protein, partial [Cytophagales bacterium]|nr:MvaI/BcnI restriction endonuclease family protein [Cytophagales bacterium]
KADTRSQLFYQLNRIYELGWIDSKRLNVLGEILPCDSSNCGGYTLEAELGITPNGYSEPDYLGWEIKQFGVTDFNKIGNSVITLMTPEPTHGFYVSEGTEAFIRKYGYVDKLGREDRMNFGGVHKVNLKHTTTELTLELIGFDITTGKIKNTDGKIALIDPLGNEAASWSFASMLKHWTRKHNQACYIPSMSLTEEMRKYKYGKRVILGQGTDFQFFLQEMAKGNIYYDPGIKIENISSKPKVKKRSQFRIKSLYLNNLYKYNEIADVSEA